MLRPFDGQARLFAGTKLDSTDNKALVVFGMTILTPSGSFAYTELSLPPGHMLGLQCLCAMTRADAVVNRISWSPVMFLLCWKQLLLSRSGSGIGIFYAIAGTAWKRFGDCLNSRSASDVGHVAHRCSGILRLWISISIRLRAEIDHGALRYHRRTVGQMPDKLCITMPKPFTGHQASAANTECA